MMVPFLTPETMLYSVETNGAEAMALTAVS